MVYPETPINGAKFYCVDKNHIDLIFKSLITKSESYSIYQIQNRKYNELNFSSMTNVF